MHARRLYAHRGASAERPENTLSAFERAVEIGVDALEMDVHVTRDNHLIVAHDLTALRTAGAQRAWADLDLADVRRLDAGWGFVTADGTRPFAGKAIVVPTFAEVLDAFPGMRINVDLK
ncbi:MAG TPA: glycerophosphodiester phosphodiesterase family protein, partial [Kofleriaceae bacterium]